MVLSVSFMNGNIFPRQYVILSRSLAKNLYDYLETLSLRSRVPAARCRQSDMD